MTSTRTPSPNPSRSTNPSPKTLENSGVLRKSGGTFPSKPCITSGIPQRDLSSKSAIAIPSPRASFKQKENERELNFSRPTRTSSPAKNPHKIMKNFMAPTISASSKITAASLRKKILSERNEILQDSVKSSSVLVEGIEMEEIRPKFEMGFDSEEISDPNRSRTMDLSGLSGHHQSTGSPYPFCCSSGTEPSLNPYDPMTNYLSPRPEFLHYKPKTMIEQNHGFVEDLLYVGDGRRLEDSFSDTEGSDDCSEHTEGTKSSPVNKEPDDEYSPIMLNTQETLVPDETYFSEPKPSAKIYKPRLYIRSFRKSNIIQYLLLLGVAFSFLPLADLPIFSPFIMKYESFAVVHTHSSGVLEDMHLKDYLAFASRNIPGLVSRLKQWSLDSIVVLISSGPTLNNESDMILSSNLTLSPSIVQNVGLGFCYSSELETVRKNEIVEGQNDSVNNMETEFELDKSLRNAWVRNNIDTGEKINFEFLDVNGDGASDEIVHKQEEDEYANYKDGLNSFTDRLFEFGTMNDQPEMIGVSISEEVDGNGYPAGFEIVQMLEEQVLSDLRDENCHSSIDEKIEVDFSDVNGDGAGDEMIKKGEDNYFMYDEGLSSFMVQSKKTDIAIAKEPDGEGYLMLFKIAQKPEEQVLMVLGQENVHLINKDDIDSSTDLVVASQMMNQNDDAAVVNFLSDVQSSVFADTNLILAALAVLAALVFTITLVFMFMKQKHTRVTSYENHLNRKNRSVSGGTVSCRDYNNESPHHNLAGLVEVVGDSGPTEMSSSLNNSSSVRHQRKKIGNHEVTPNSETLQRRESGVSSSISYGSFTAFEKTSLRKGEKDEEVMTPVRRSSRIRNQAISPCV